MNKVADLSENLIRTCLRNNLPDEFVHPLQDGYAHAAVLIPLLKSSGEWNLLYTRRTQNVQTHKGQVSFPGGAAEPGDQSLEATALREAREEIGLEPSDVRVLGKIQDYPTISHFVITPIVGIIPWPYTLCLSKDEVHRVFTIPLSWLIQPDNLEERPYTLPDGRHENVLFFKQYDCELLWGVTARITFNFLKIIQLLN